MAIGLCVCVCVCVREAGAVGVRECVCFLASGVRHGRQASRQASKQDKKEHTYVCLCFVCVCEGVGGDR